MDPYSLPPLRERALVTAGIAALQRYQHFVARNGLDGLSNDELLLFRSASTLEFRLDVFVSVDFALNGSSLSAADVWALEDMAKAMPEERATFAALGAAIARVV